jgi:hypothetical protein
MKNLHLVSPIVIDIVDKLKASKNPNERMNLVMRLEAIEEYIWVALNDELGRTAKEKPSRK